MVSDLIFAILFGAYAITWWVYSSLFYWEFRDIGVKNTLIQFCKKNFYLNTLFAILLIPSILVGLLSLRIEKWFTS